MAVTRSDTTNHEVYFIAMIRDDLETSIKNQIKNYKILKDNLSAFASVVKSDDAFLQPGKVLGNFFKDINDTGNEVLSQLKTLEKLINDKEKTLIDSEERVREIAKDKITSLNDVNKEVWTQELYTAFIGVVERCSPQEESSNTEGVKTVTSSTESSKLDLALSESEKKMGAASQATKSAFNQIKKQVEAIKDVNKQCQQASSLIKQRKDILSWMTDRKLFADFSDFDDLVDNIEAKTDAAISAILKTFRQSAQKSVIDNTSLVIETRVRKAERRENKIRPTERLHTLLVKKRAVLDKCKRELVKALDDHRACSQEIVTTEQVIVGLEKEKGFLEKQLTSIKLSETTRTNITTLLAKTNHNLISRKTYLAAWKTIPLSAASIELLNKHSASMAEHLALFEKDGVYDQLFKAPIAAINTAEDMIKKLQAFYSIDPFKEAQLSSNFSERVAQYSKEVKALPKKIEDIKAQFQILSDKASEIMSSMGTSKEVTDAVSAMIKQTQIPKPIVGAEEDIGQSLNDLRTTISQEEAAFDASQLALLKAEEEAAARVLAEKKSAQLAIVAVDGESDAKNKKVLVKKKRRIVINDSSEEELPVNSIMKEKNATPRPPVPKPPAVKPQQENVANNRGSAYAIAKHFQQKILAAKLTTTLGGSTISVLNPTDTERKEEVTLPSFAATMASVFNQEISREKVKKIDETRILMTHLQANAHATLAKPSFFRHVKTQSLYHDTERDSYLLGRILNIDALHVQNTIVPHILALPKPVASTSETVSTNRKMAALYKQVAALSRDTTPPAQLVELYTSSAALAYDPAIAKEEREYALHCMMLLGDVDVKATLDNIKNQIKRHNAANAWGTFNGMPTTVREIFTLITTSQEDDISQLLSIMDIARKAALSDHLSRSKFTQAFYQQLGYGVEYLTSATHYKLRYLDKQYDAIPNKGEILCSAGGVNGKPWKVRYIAQDGTLIQKSIASTDLKDKEIPGVMPLSQADMIILGQFTKLPIDTQIPREIPEPTASCKCW